MKYYCLLLKSLLFIVFALRYSAAFSQGITTASISGNVHNESFPLNAATIVATQINSDTRYSVKSNSKGDFSIQGMRVGIYQIEVSSVGYQKQIVTDVSLALGQNLSFDFSMKETSNELEEIVITARKFGGIKDVKSGVGLTIGNESIRQMPTVSRSINDFTRLVPQAGSQGMMGKGAKSNNITIDGASFNNFMGLGGESSGALPGGNVGA